MSATPPSEHPRDVLQARDIRARRALGQHFLISPKNMDRVVEAACVEPDDVILEIGTGLGRLTDRLAARARAVVSVEIDPGLCEIARERLAGHANVKLLCGDFLASKHRINPEVTCAFMAAGGEHRAKVVSNLPYQISSPAIIALLEWEIPLAEMDVMLQAEVAARLTARAGEAQYGPLTVFAAYHAEVENLFSLPPTAFWPRSGVSSSLVRVTPRPPQPPARDYGAFCEVVNGLLQQRRKTLARGLQLGWGRARARLVLDALDLDPSLRPGTLCVAEFVRIADVLASHP